MASQWPGAIVQLPNGSFCVDTCVSFGMGPSAGVYGHVADAGLDLLRAEGIGPITKWVDDHLFFRIRREYLASYNDFRLSLHTSLDSNGKEHSGGRLWYKGDQLVDGSHAVYAEDCSSPLIDLSSHSPCSSLDSEFSYAFPDIDRASDSLDIPWEPSKDTAFAFFVVYIGLLWNVAMLTIELLGRKKEKYQTAITTWRSQKTHVLLDVQQLYGKLLHACLVVPAGRTYLTSLEAMLSICSAHPFVPYHSIKHLEDDLDWWTTLLARSFVGRSIKLPSSLVDMHAFSDASTSVSVAIVIDGYWRAWSLRPGWQTLDGQRDIGWAECAGLELLILAILELTLHSTHRHFRIYCDNQGIVEGWKNGQSRNRETNVVFRRIHAKLDTLDSMYSFHPQYIPSRDNPADGPSRGIFPPRRLLLPPIMLPPELSKFLVDADLDNCVVRAHNLPNQPTHDKLVGETSYQAFGDELFHYCDIWSDTTQSLQ